MLTTRSHSTRAHPTHLPATLVTASRPAQGCARVHETRSSLGSLASLPLSFGRPPTLRSFGRPNLLGRPAHAVGHGTLGQRERAVISKHVGRCRLSSTQDKVLCKSSWNMLTLPYCALCTMPETSCHIINRLSLLLLSHSLAKAFALSSPVNEWANHTFFWSFSE